MRLYKYICIALLGSTLASCSHYKSLYSDYERPDSLGIDINALYRDTASVDGILAADTTNFGNLHWREVFTDPLLQQLIERALQANTDVRKADLTIRQAEQGLMTSRLAYFPTLAFTPTGTLSSYDFNKATKTYNVPISASWQADVFGTIRNAKKQSEMTLYQTRAAKQATQTAIVASVANLYYTLEMLDEQVQTTTETAELWDKNVNAMDAMMQAGMTNGAAVSQAKANRLSIISSLPTLQSSIRQTENSLCALLHETPHSIARGKLADANFPDMLSAGVPLQMLANRPDVRASELQLAYAYYGVLGARGAFYPSITISPSAGWTNTYGNPGKILATLVGQLTQPLFQQGKLKANYEIAKLNQESALLDFEQSLLDAGNEVSNALTTYQTTQRTIAAQEDLVKQLEVANDQTDFMFHHGNTTTYLETLTTQQSLLQAQLTLISDRFDRVQAVITLYQALGGGWEADENSEE